MSLFVMMSATVIRGMYRWTYRSRADGRATGDGAMECVDTAGDTESRGTSVCIIASGANKVVGRVVAIIAKVWKFKLRRKRCGTCRAAYSRHPLRLMNFPPSLFD
jgi:hypothetical protein